ncbi:MAG: hypothetical protein AAFQ43_09920 [Bacteroidota bacterium]
MPPLGLWRQRSGAAVGWEADTPTVCPYGCTSSRRATRRVALVPTARGLAQPPSSTAEAYPHGGGWQYGLGTSTPEASGGGATFAGSPL